MCAGIAGHRLDELRDGRRHRVPHYLEAQVSRELDRLELIIAQIKAVEAARDALVAPGQPDNPDIPASGRCLMGLRGIGQEFADVLYFEGVFRHFDDRRRVAAYSGLGPTPWQSGSIDRGKMCEVGQLSQEEPYSPCGLNGKQEGHGAKSASLQP